MRKRIFSLLLVVALVLGEVPLSVIAAENYLWPVPGHTGLSRGYSSQHLGLDITDGSIQGANIVATKSGKILKWWNACQHLHSAGTCSCSEATSGFGNGLILEHPDGTYSYYAHMEYNSIPSQYRSVGASVTRGAVIGRVGSAGNSTGYHLHFALGTNRWNYDPYSIYNVDPSSVSYDYGEASSSFGNAVDIGTGFYAKIINTESWKPITYDYDWNITLRSEKKSLELSQTWYFERLADKSYKITSAKDGRCMEVHNFETTAGTNVHMNDYSGNSAQQWFIYGEPSKYILRGKCTQCVLDLANGSTTDGTNIQMWTKNDTPAQLFQIYRWGTPEPYVSLSTPLTKNIGETTATGVSSVINEGRLTVDKIGFNLWDTVTGKKISGAQAVAENLKTNAKIDFSFDFSKVAGMNLEAGRKYEYQMFAIVKGQTFYSAKSLFTSLTSGISNPTESSSPEIEEPSKPEPTPYPGTPFTDISGHWGKESIKWAYTENLFSGTSVDKFSPNNSMSRGMLATVLYRLKGSPSVSGDSGFWDVSGSQYYAKPVKWAADNKIVSGMGGGSFAPDSSITREQLAVMLHNYEIKFGNTGDSSAGLSQFTDGGAVSPWAQDAVRWAVSQGILSGKGDGRLDPKGTATRAEVASMLYRFAK